MKIISSNEFVRAYERPFKVVFDKEDGYNLYHPKGNVGCVVLKENVNSKGRLLLTILHLSEKEWVTKEHIVQLIEVAS